MNKLRRYFTLGVFANEFVVTGRRTPAGYQQISAATLATAQNLTLPTLTVGQAGMQVGYTLIQANGGAIRWRDDGTAPTASVGMLIADGGELTYTGDPTKIKLILSTSTPTADISYYF